MAFQTKVAVNGVGNFQISSSIKKFTLIDLGFVTNNAGAYILKRSLQPEQALDQAISLKVVFKKDLAGMKIETVGAAGGPVDVTKRADAKEIEKLMTFFLNEMVDRQVLEQVA
ncbi:hypothetical protein FFRU_011290 [Fructobacillus fructosus]|uniref:hypothetical protein n=1 Tax=Fructobacillus fructosus TaxID=1631 RepID=UPI000219573D|nr:hypothetical protein [Fructobacillus fructosus]CAK1225289.1 hypothetical protein R53140_OCIKHKEL_00173 [Fructobacillus fructosus]CAK1231746.1 hypothetical protein R54866_LGPIEIPA_00463 [Fructobacillus fructosus]CAK1232899.1 hypothetical protein LMG30235_GOPAMIKF_00527 [Fructobacillus fructosus]CAK1233071.1 hypothetical protein LMG30234_GAICNKDF_00524 [Fructobacillus fructosus]GAP00723.1 hypothetical protein FFRU_011290 [Fructobacillus fructosus]